MRAANVRYCAIHHNHFNAQKVIGGHTVFQTMGTTGVHRDISRNGASQLAGWIWCIEEAHLFHSAGDAKVCAARADANVTIWVVGFQYRIQTGRTKDYAIGRGQSATGQ